MATKLMCGWRGCRSTRCCKNRGRTLCLSRDEVNWDKIRMNMRTHCKRIRFCCSRHLKVAKLAKPRQQLCRFPQEVGRVALSVCQLSLFLQTLLSLGEPAAAVIALLQIHLGERADAACSVQRQWFRNLKPGVTGPVTIHLPAVNKKRWKGKLPWSLSSRRLLASGSMCSRLRLQERCGHTLGRMLTKGRCSQAWPPTGPGISPSRSRSEPTA